MRAGPCARRPGWGQKQVMRPRPAKPTGWRMQSQTAGGKTRRQNQSGMPGSHRSTCHPDCNRPQKSRSPNQNAFFGSSAPTLFMPPKMGSSLPFQAEASDLGPAWLLSESRSLPRAMICLPVASFSQPQLCPQRPHGPLLPQPQNCSSEIWTQWPRPQGWSWRQMPQEES